MDLENINVNDPEFIINLTPEQKLIKRNFERIYGTELSNEQLIVINQAYQSRFKEAKKDIGIYRGINVLLFIILFVLALIFTGSWVFRIILSCLLFYNIVHLWINIKEYKSM